MESTLHYEDAVYVKEAKEFKRNEIVVFSYYGDDYNSPPDENGRYRQSWAKRLYRLIALSGDQLEIKKGEVLVNGSTVPLPAGGLVEYLVKSSIPIDDLPDRPFTPSYDIQKIGDTLKVIASLTHAELTEYRSRKPAIIEISRFLAPYDPGDTSLIRACDSCQWTTDEFGPLTIPSSGETIEVNEFNYRLYRNIPGIKMGRNTITEKLYFVMGDNRHGAQDSRYIGFISHSNMTGIVK